MGDSPVLLDYQLPFLSVIACMAYYACSHLSFSGAVGHFLKFLFLLGRLCKLFDKALVCGLACAALAMCLQKGLMIHIFKKVLSGNPKIVELPSA
jgi:hypothetical protein